MNIYLKLYDIKTKKTFKKFFDTELERDKFIRKLRYSKKLIIRKDYDYGYSDERLCFRMF